MACRCGLCFAARAYRDGNPPLEPGVVRDRIDALNWQPEPATGEAS